jgi:SecD/SecF fusion protein
MAVSLGATVALIHDTLFTLLMFSIFWGILPFSLEIDQAFIAAIHYSYWLYC